MRDLEAPLQHQVALLHWDPVQAPGINSPVAQRPRRILKYSLFFSFLSELLAEVQGTVVSVIGKNSPGHVWMRRHSSCFLSLGGQPAEETQAEAADSTGQQGCRVFLRHFP